MDGVVGLNQRPTTRVTLGLPIHSIAFNSTATRQDNTCVTSRISKISHFVISVESAAAAAAAKDDDGHTITCSKTPRMAVKRYLRAI